MKSLITISLICFFQTYMFAQIRPGSYFIINKASGKALAINGVSLDNGAYAIISNDTGDDHLLWLVEPLGNGIYEIISEHSRKLLNVTGASTVDGAAVIQWPRSNTENEKWMLVPVGNGYFRIAAKHSLKFLGVTGGSRNTGARIIQWRDDGTDNQQWMFREFTLSVPPSSGSGGLSVDPAQQGGLSVSTGQIPTVEVPTNSGISVPVATINPPPVITQFYPSIASPGTTVTLTGQNFEDFINRDRSAKVTINNIPLLVTSATSTELKIMIQSNTPNGPIKIATRWGSKLTRTVFKRNLQIHSVFPQSGKVGDQIEIRGTGFSKYPITKISVGNYELNSHDYFIYDSVIRFRVTEQVQSGMVIISTNEIVFASGERIPRMLIERSNAFTRISVPIPSKSNNINGRSTSSNSPALTISGFSPRQACAGETVTITGSGFTGVTRVTFETRDVNFQIINDRVIRLMVGNETPSGYVQVFKGSNYAVLGAYIFTRLNCISTPSPATNKPKSGAALRKQQY